MGTPAALSFSRTSFSLPDSMSGTTAAGFSQLVMVYMYYKPSLGRVAVSTFDANRYGVSEDM